MGTNKDISFSFHAEAKINASLRTGGTTVGVGKAAFKHFDTKEIFDITDELIEFHLSIPSDEDLEGKIRLSLSGNHMENKADGEYYHNSIEMLITKTDLANIAKAAQVFAEINIEDEP